MSAGGGPKKDQDCSVKNNFTEQANLNIFVILINNINKSRIYDHFSTFSTLDLLLPLYIFYLSHSLLSRSIPALFLVCILLKKSLSSLISFRR